jgi:hypothetical protein
MSVTFMIRAPELASSRYRAQMPQDELAKLGIARGRDVLVASKHGFDWDEAARGFRKIVFDVCTDYFQKAGAEREFYLHACASADAIVAASAEMARRIKAHTGRTAWVIEDPYEERECEPAINETLFWHGHQRNIIEIKSVSELQDGYPLLLVTGGETVPKGFNRWSLEMMDAAYSECGMVLLPYHAGNYESTANRAINAIRRGRWPVCRPMPALAELGVWQGDIAEGVQWALANQDEVLSRLRTMQAYVAQRFSPAAIALKWRAMLQSL